MFFLDVYLLVTQIEYSCCGRRRQSYFSCIEQTLTSLRRSLFFTNYVPEERSAPFWVINLPQSDPQWAPNLGGLRKSCRFLTLQLPRPCHIFHIHLSPSSCSWGTTWQATGMSRLGLNIWVDTIVLVFCLDSLDLLIRCFRPRREGDGRSYRIFPTGLPRLKAKCVMCSESKLRWSATGTPALEVCSDASFPSRNALECQRLGLLVDYTWVR